MEHKQEMHDVVEMLLNRMKNYPEDFIGNPNDYRDMVENKWKRALRLIGGVVAPHEKEALDIRLEEARRAVYMGAALKEILGPDEPMQEVEDLEAKNRATITQSGSNTTTLQNTAMQSTIKTMQQNALMNAYSQSFLGNGSFLG